MMTDNRTTERIDHPPRVREAIDELMREKDATGNRTTELLRKLLDERGVEWTYADGTVSFADSGRWYHAWAYSDGAMCVSMGYLTPDQAIAATLGQAERTCENVGERCDFACSECGARLYTETSDGYTMILVDEETILLKPNYCPNCGAKVVS